MGGAGYLARFSPLFLDSYNLLRFIDLVLFAVLGGLVLASYLWFG
jgi:hypothetical protein